MAYVITQKCVGTCDTACIDVCPCDCIVGPVPLDQLRAVPAAERGSRFPGIQMFVDPDECIDCGACEAECPVAAIYLDDDVPAEHRSDIERNAKFFRRQTPHVLFLDIDGVLNRTGQRPDVSLGLRSWIEPELAGRLSHLLRAIDA